MLFLADLHTKGSAEVESSSSLVWRKENFLKGHFRAGPLFKLQKLHLELRFSCDYYP